MIRADQNVHPIQIVVNYWEIGPIRMKSHLHELVRSGLKEVVSFVPWKALESDISHALLRYLRVAAEVGLHVRLIVTPEPGVHFANSGLPKDLVSSPELLAKSIEGQPVMVSLAPNAYAIPSLLTPDFQKRYSSYLSRIESVLTEAQTSFGIGHITIAISGSYFKYLRPAVGQPFEFECGDFSSGAMLQFRQAVEQFYAKPEFSHRNPILANQWKSRSMEPANAKWFFQSIEEAFRYRTLQTLQRKTENARFLDVELFTPEADPSLSYGNWLRWTTGQVTDFFVLNRFIDLMATHAARTPMIHWTSLGGFHELSDPERQFLVLKSLLLFGAKGGSVLIDELEWRTLSRGFRNRCETLGRALSQKQMTCEERLFYLAPHQWSSGEPIWSELRRKVGPRVRRVAQFDAVVAQTGMLQKSQIVFVDPSLVITADLMRKLLSWVGGSHERAPRILVLPKNGFTTDVAQDEFESWYTTAESMKVNLGVSYELLQSERGRIVLFDALLGDLTDREAHDVWERFVASMLTLADYRDSSQFSDVRLDGIYLDRPQLDEAAVFVMNGTRGSIAADLVLPMQAQIRDLVGVLVQGGQSGQSNAKPNGVSTPELPTSAKFSLEVPAYGVLPVALQYVKPKPAVSEAPLSSQQTSSQNRPTEGATTNP